MAAAAWSRRFGGVREMLQSERRRTNIYDKETGRI
jgi:hypothetical protein